MSNEPERVTLATADLESILDETITDAQVRGIDLAIGHLSASRELMAVNLPPGAMFGWDSAIAWLRKLSERMAP